MFKFSERSQRVLSGVDQRLSDIAHAALAITPVDFGIPANGGIRTEQEQVRLFRLGKSKLNGVDKVSLHQLGLALDFFAVIDGKATWRRPHLAMVGASFLQAASNLGHQLEWGGFWQPYTMNIYGWDMPHVQMPKEQ